ncbi:hypothetical protein QBC34DRAFT_421459 [Podospora aff. communis PSN243]|uniref:DUF7726 domain-containing protein n=1 Tax=Podospora aff. communis PSN243 TaxID=3040156 RepID=A0AAV9H084_9PEZI|nr:hypothetical protein QBC34DRAFT_421459 [Podospora aff. communis PSN243]
MTEVPLLGDDDGSIPIFDTCDEVRRKIKLFLKRVGVNQPGFLRGLARIRPKNKEYKGKTMSAASFQAFMKLRGPSAGAEKAIFYVAYVFFEKLRIRDGKPKTELREKVEDVWGKYRDPTTGRWGFLINRKNLVCRDNEKIVEDKYGILRAVAKGMRWARSR